MKSFFALFTESPNSFQGQEPGERIVLFLRRHPFTILIKVIGISLGFILPIVVSIVFINYIIFYGFFYVYLFVVSVLALIAWIMIAYTVTMYTLDVWIITDTRILDSTQHGFFNRTVSELHMSRIQDVYIKTEGTFQTVIGFGDLFIQTAGTEERFMFYQIPQPLHVKDVIMSIAFPEEHKPTPPNS